MHRGEGGVPTEAETGVMWLPAMECWLSPEAGGTTLPGASEGNVALLTT